MNYLAKVSVSVLVGLLSLTAESPRATAGEVLGVSVPNVSKVTAEVSRFIANELAAQLRQALNAPRQARVRRSPQVIVEETAGVIVTATRLPPLDGGAEHDVVRTAQVQSPVRL
jgi:hypothetical protein